VTRTEDILRAQPEGKVGVLLDGNGVGVIGSGPGYIPTLWSRKVRFAHSL
jgi:hypothetical protein